MGFALNSREEPFNDIKVRQAIANLWNVIKLMKNCFLTNRRKEFLPIFKVVFMLIQMIN